MQRFRGGLVFKAYRILYHSTLGLRVIKRKRVHPSGCGVRALEVQGGVPLNVDEDLVRVGSQAGLVNE